MKIFHIALLILCSYFLSYTVKASEQLPYCQKDVCETVLHNKVLQKATVVVWKGNSEILQTLTFDLDKKATLVSKTNENKDYKLFSYEKNLSTSSASEPPPPPSNQGSSSVAVVRTYETATEIITITITFIYFNGQLVDIATSPPKRTPKPNIPTEEK